MSTLQELQAAKAEIEAQIAAKKAADAEARTTAITVIKLQCAELGITARDLFEPVKLDPVYRGPNGETWTNKGLVPKWLAALEAAGHSRESFRIKAD
jgi:DNA-binding protein H-NS